MGGWFTLFFAEEDVVLVEAIAKLHKVPVKVVEKEYKEMLKAIKNALQA